MLSHPKIHIEELSVCMQENGDGGDDGFNRGVQYPFSVSEKVMIKVSYFPSLSRLSAFVFYLIK